MLLLSVELSGDVGGVAFLGALLVVFRGVTVLEAAALFLGAAT